MPLIVRHRATQEYCSVSREGIGMVQAVVERAGWTAGCRIQVGFIESVKCLLFREAANDEGFKLAFSNTRKNTGGRIYCNAFIRNYLATIVSIPKKSLVPVFAKKTDWSVALFLEPISWKKEEFGKSGADALDKDLVGAYELLGLNDCVLRIGEGKIRDRINMHLRDARFAPPTVKAFRYVALSTPADSPLLEQLLLAEYEDTIGVLPRFQEIRA